MATGETATIPVSADKRTLQITHDNVEVLVNALKIAGYQFFDKYEKMIRSANEANNPAAKVEKNTAEHYLDISNRFFDAATNIEDGKFDV
jgi:hypothetical protein